MQLEKKKTFYIFGKIPTPFWRLTLVNVWGKRFKLPTLTHERFLTIYHSCKMFFWYLPNWTSTDLWCVVLYVTYSTTHQRSLEVQFSRYKKKPFCRSDIWSKISHVLVLAAWNVFPIHSLNYELASTFQTSFLVFMTLGIPHRGLLSARA